MTVPLRRRLTRRSLLWALGGTAVVVGIAVVPSLLHHEPAYVPGEAVAGITRDLDRTTPATRTISFEDLTAAAGIDFVPFAGAVRSSQLPEDMGSGAAWGDPDGDGNPDLLLVDFDGPVGGTESGRGNRFYRNLGDGRFVDATEEAGLAWRGHGLGALFFDADGDGDEDLVVTTWGENVFFRNRGDGHFEEATAAAGLGGKRGFWTGVAAADADGDGLLDLYVCGYVDYRYDPRDLARTAKQYGEETPFTLNPSSYPPLANLFYRNLGGGRFEEVAAERGIANPEGRSLSALWSDVDDDGDLDLYVANDVSDNVLYVNDGTGFFEDRSHEAGVADYRGAMGLATGDVDGDGAIDLVVTHWLAQENALYLNQLGKGSKVLRFQDDADRRGIGQIALDDVGWGIALVDFDGDGDRDLYVANGSTLQDRDDPTRLVAMKDRLFEAGPKGFVEIPILADGSGLPPASGRAVAVADWNRDGSPDLVATRNGGPPVLLANRAPRGERPVVVLVGKRPNVRAIGARVEIVARDGRRFVDEVQAGGSYLGESFPELFPPFSASEIEVIRVRWPDGVDESFAPLGSASRWRLERGRGKKP